MSTTQLFAELLISGIGVLIWLVILIAAIFKIPFQNIPSNANVFTLAPIVGVAYVLGIMVDRLGYSLFSGLEARTRNGIILPDKLPSAENRERYILVSSKELSTQIVYNRSRLRICRSWTINFFLIAVSSGIWGYTSPLRMPVMLLSLLSLLLSVMIFFVWRRLSKDYYVNIQASYAFLTGSKTGGIDNGYEREEDSPPGE